MPSRACGKSGPEDGRANTGMLLPAPKPVARGRSLLFRAAREALRRAVWALCVAATARAQTQFGAQPVGTASAVHSIAVKVTVAGMVRRVEVLTLGAADGDFTAAAEKSSCTDADLPVGGSCLVPAVFTPSAPGVRLGAVVLLGTASDANVVLGATYLAGLGTGGLGVLVAGAMLPVAGAIGSAIGAKNGEPSTRLALAHPSGLAMDGAGNLYVADAGDNRVWMVCSAAARPVMARTVCAGAGTWTDLAGNGEPGYTGDGGPAAQAGLNQPGGLALDGAGNLFIADTGNNAIREVNAATGAITTVAGNANGAICAGASDGIGDGCPAAESTLSQPQGVAVDASGDLFLADTGDNAIRAVNAATGAISIVAGLADGDGDDNGDGRQAGRTALNHPVALAFDAAGDLFLAEAANNRVREILAVEGAIGVHSTIRTVAGTGEAIAAPCATATAPLPAGESALWSPSGVAVDAAGNLWIAEAGDAALRKVSAATGQIATLLANGCGDAANGPIARPSLAGALAILLDDRGDLYIADAARATVNELLANAATLDDAASPAAVEEPAQDESSPPPLAIENDGNAPLVLASIAAGDGAELDAAVENACAEGETLAVDTSCAISVTRKPGAATTTLAAGPAKSADITIAAKNQNGVAASGSPMRIELASAATTSAATTTTVTCNPCTAGFGQSAAFTIAVSAAAGSGALTGTVRMADTFNGATTTLAAGLAPSAAGVVHFSIATLAVGLHSIVASYDNTNDPSHAASTSSPPLIETILEGTAVHLTASVNPASPGQNITFTATVTSLGGGIAPTGAVTFMDGATVLGAPALSTSGVATFTTSTLVAGSHWIVAVYGGVPSSEVEGSTSQAVAEQVQASSSIAITSSLNPSTYGVAVGWTATVASQSGAAATGAVNFLENGVSIGSAKLGGNPGAATLTVSTLAAGTHPIIAAYAGDSANQPSTSASPLNQIVEKAPTVTILSAAPASGVAGAPETLSATVELAKGSAPLTGAVNFTVGTTLLASAALNAQGVATATITLAAGSYQIVATYAGDANSLASASDVLACVTASPSMCSASTPLLLLIAQATTRTALAVTPIPAEVLSPVNLTATVASAGGTPSGSVNFLADGVVIGSAALANGIASLGYAGLSVGNHSMTAAYTGDANNAASASASIAETVGLIPTTTVLGASTSAGSSAQTELTAVVANNGSGPAPTGTVAFWNGAANLGTATLDASGIATLAPVLVQGVDYTIDAVYSGDASHSASTSQTIAVSGTAIGFAIAVSPAAATVAEGQSAAVTVTLTAIASFSDTVDLGCASLPAMTRCQFASASLNLPAGGTVSTQLTLVTQTSSSGTGAMSGRANGTGLLFAILLAPLGFIGRRLRRSSSWTYLAGLVAMLVLAAMAAGGCSSSIKDQTVPGSYVLQITGSGASTHVSASQNFNLVITK